MSDAKFDPYEWARHTQGDDVFSPGDIALSLARQIQALLKHNKDAGVQKAALRVLNSFAAIVADKENFAADPALMRAALTRMYVMGAEAMRLAIIFDVDDDETRARLLEQFKRDVISIEQSMRARHARGPRKKERDEAIRQALRRNPESTWKEIATDLEGDGHIVYWDDENVEFFDDDQPITARRFQNLLAELRRN